MSAGHDIFENASEWAHPEVYLVHLGIGDNYPLRAGDSAISVTWETSMICRYDVYRDTNGILTAFLPLLDQGLRNRHLAEFPVPHPCFHL
jgi:hypothetical protein